METFIIELTHMPEFYVATIAIVILLLAVVMMHNNPPPPSGPMPGG